MDLHIQNSVESSFIVMLTKFLSLSFLVLLHITVFTKFSLHETEIQSGSLILLKSIKVHICLAITGKPCGCNMSLAEILIPVIFGHIFPTFSC